MGTGADDAVHTDPGKILCAGLVLSDPVAQIQMHKQHFPGRVRLFGTRGHGVEIGLQRENHLRGGSERLGKEIFPHGGDHRCAAKTVQKFFFFHLLLLPGKIKETQKRRGHPRTPASPILHIGFIIYRETPSVKSFAYFFRNYSTRLSISPAVKA